MLASFSTSTVAGSGSENDKLSLDDLYCIYDKGLSSVSIGGTDNPTAKSVFNAAEFATHEPSRTYDDNGNPSFNNSGTASYNYTASVCYSSDNDFPQVAASPKSKLITGFTIVQASTANHYATITVTHNDNSTFIYTINFTNAKPAPTITLNSSDNTYSACAGETITVTASGASTYSWDGGLGSGATVHPTTSGTYHVTGTGSNGCTGSATAYVTVKPLPEVKINNAVSSTASLCSGSGAQVTLTASGAATYNWSNGSTATSINVNTGGTYTVVGTTNGCSNTASVTVTAYPSPNVTIDAPTYLCSGTTATITAGGANTYVWGGNGSGSDNPLTISAPGTYSVTGTDEHNCTGTASVSIATRQSPTVTISGTTSFCSGSSTTLTASSNLPNTDFEWTGGGTGTTLSVNAVGQYTVTGTKDGCSGSASVTVTEAASPAAPTVISDTLCGNNTATLTVANPVQDLTYHWYTSATAPSESGAGTTFTTPTLSSSTTYYVSAQNAAGCHSTRTAATVLHHPLPAAPTVSNTSVCGESDITLTATSTNTVKWYSDNAGNNETTANQHVSATSTFYAAALDENGCRSTLAPMTVTVKEIPTAPTATTNPASPICSNDPVSVTFNATAPTGSIVKWYDSQLQGAGQGPQVTKSVSGTTTYYAAIFNNNTQCESAKTPVQIVINALPAAPTVTPASVCGSGDIVLTDQSSNATNWYSDPNGETTATTNQHITASTTFYAAIIDNNNCRSALVPMTVTANPVYPNATDDKTACGSYTWEGTTYDASGSYTKTLHTVNGCDSTVTLNLTINDGYTVSFDTTVCNQFVWQGETYTSSQTITKNLKSVSNCDSTVTCHLTVKHSSASAQTLTLCSSETPYNFLGTSINASGTYTIHTENAEGCDSTITLTVTVNPTPGEPTLTSKSICGAGTATLTASAGQNGNGCRWYATETGGTPFNETPNYTNTFSESDTFFVSSINTNTGCESGRFPVTITVNAVPAVPTVSKQSLCGAGEVTMTATSDTNATTCRWYANATTNNPLETGFTYTRNVSAALNIYFVESYNENTGCKSIRVRDTVVVNPIPATPQVTAATHCGPLTADLADYVTTPAALYRWYDANETQLAENAHYSTTINETTTYWVSIYNDETTCESAKATLTITINPTYAPQSIYDTVCQNAEYHNHGINQTFTTAGEQTFVLSTVTNNGCDSVVTLYLHVKPQATYSFADQACEQYVWNNMTYTQSGEYTQTFTAANGCDSVATLTLTIFTPDHTDINAQACGSYTWNGQTYTESGNYDQTFQNSSLCDSIVTLHLTIHPLYQNEFDMSACDEYVWNGQTYTASGNYTQDLTSSHNCDSTVTMHLTIHQPATVELYDEVCAGTAYTQYGFNELFTEPGQQILTSNGQTIHHCDSTTIVHLTVKDVYAKDVYETICHNSTFTFNGQEYSETGEYTANLTAANGCDSIVTLHLTVRPENNGEIFEEVCEGSSYNENGFDITEASETQDYERHDNDVNGCDSVTVLHLTVHHPAATNLTATLCLGETYTDYNFEFNAYTTGTFTETQSLQTVHGCDSIVTLTVTVNTTSATVLEGETCENSRYQNYGFDTTFAQNGIYTLTHNDLNVFGCDSVTTLTLTVYPTFETDVYDTICFNGVYDFHGVTINETGDYNTTLSTVNGCDSVINLHLYVRPEKRREISADICEGAAYNAYDFVIEQANETMDTLRTVTDMNGCDSTTVLHLIVHQPVTTNLSATLCNGETYNQNGFQFTALHDGDTTLTRVLPTSFGCDSTVNLHITVNPTHHVKLNGQVCAGETYTEYGFDTLFTAAGSHTLYHYDENVFGCDSVTELHLTVRQVYHQNIAKMICESGNYIFNGDTLTTAGVYTANLTSIYGCDSIVTLTLTVGEEFRDTIEADVCYGNDYMLNGFEITNATQTGYHERQYTDPNGCPATTVLHLIVHELNTTDLYATLCFGESYRLNGFNVTASQVGDTTHTRIVHTMYGCDSTVVLHLTVNPTSTVTLSDEICTGHRYELNGFDTLFNEAGIYTLINHDLNIHQCDSTTTLTLRVWPNLSSESEEYICFGGSYDFHGKTLTEAGTYVDTLNTVHGCDSIVTLHLHIYPENATSISDTACVTYTWNEATYMESGNYIQHFTDVHGCDSTVTLHLVVNTADTLEIADTACVTYTWNDVTYTTSGDYFQSFQNVNGCDSTVTLHLVIHTADTMEISDAACMTYSWNEETYTETGDYVQHFLNANGCDSTVTLHLTIHAADTTEYDTTACVAYTWNETTYTETGDYTQQLQNQFGCDSIVTLHLSIHAADTTAFDTASCVTYTWNGVTYTETGDYTQSFQNVNGCDSTVTLHLTIHPADTTAFDATACVTYTWNEVTYTESGDYTQSFQNVNGCDSTVTLHLTIYDADTIAFDTTACVAYTWNEVTYTETGDYTQSFTNANGCDSTVTLHLTIYDADTTTFDATACVAYTWNEITYTASGEYTQTLQNANGCDSLVTLHLTINTADTLELDTTACVTYTWNEVTYTETGDYTQSFTNANGCDSTVTLHLTINPAHDVHLYDTICLGEHYMANGFDTIPAAADDYTLVHQGNNIYGCDSVTTLHLTVHPTSNVEHSAAICLGTTFNQYGFDTLMTEAGTYTLVHEGQNIHGCDSTTTVTLTVNPFYSKDTTVNICDVDIPFLWDGEQYWETDDYTITYSTVNGCDSIIYLHLNVHPTYEQEMTVTVCNGALPYVFDESHSYNQAGTYTINLQTVNGCDSTWILHLNVTPNAEHTATETICDNALPFTFMGETFQTAGTYDITEADADNCLTITHFTLNVNPTYHHYDTVTVCEETLPYTYGTTPLTTTGDYDIHFNTAFTCDSLISVHFTVIPTAQGVEEQYVCTSDFPVVYGGETFTQEGVYEVTFHRNGLCDSIVTFTLHEAQEYLFTTTDSICDHALPYEWRGKELTQTGVYFDSLSTQHGCDSVYRLNLTVNETQLIVSDPIVLCAGETETWHGMTLAESGTYRDTVNSITTGCYEIYEVSVTVNPTYYFYDTVTICSDDLPYVWHEITLQEAGVREEYNQTVNSCDSIYHLVLYVNPSYHTTETASACDYDLPYPWHGQSLTQNGTYYDTLTTAAGCDSTFTLTFTVNPSNFTSTADTVCASSLPYQWRNQTFTASGTYYDTVQNSYGCDDVYELQLTVNAVDAVTIYDTVCAGSYYMLNGFDTLTAEAGILYDQLTLTNAAGCDSTVTLVLQVMPNYLFETNAETCENAPYEWHGGTYAIAGTYYDSLTTQYGCDSVYVLNLTINPTYDIYVSDSAVTFHEYTYESLVVFPTDSGVQEHDIQYYTLAGCDSIVHLTLYVALNEGIDDFTMTPAFSFYPNPTSARLNIEGERMREVQVFNITGKLVGRSYAETPEFVQIDVTSFATGHYLVKVILEDGNTVTGKIVVNRK